jgi:phosphoglycolate phosphatase-like HAD superfamily hydrolase
LPRPPSAAAPPVARPTDRRSVQTLSVQNGKATYKTRSARFKRAWVDALAEFAHQVPYERVRPLIGMGGDKVLPLLTGLSAHEGKGKQIAERREEIFASRYLPQVRPLPGARELQARMVESRRRGG